MAGVVRSGSSLLYSLVNQHPEISLMYECDVWDFPNALSARRFRGEWLARQEFYNNALSRHRLIYGGSLRGLEKVKSVEGLYRTYSHVNDARFFGEKSPTYCTRLKELAQRYPGCSFILVWRDPVEISQSVAQAGRRSRFFRRKGMLSRIIFYQEQMIRQAAWLKKNGARVHHVRYEDLSESPEAVCKGICEFLGVEFDSRMVDLSRADFSAIHKGDEHDYLQGVGLAKRQTPVEQLIPESTLGKLQRYQNRWHRLVPDFLKASKAAPAVKEPGLLELAYHRVAGGCLNRLDEARRACFEFLPLPWLKTYRLLKEWYLGGESGLPRERWNLPQELADNWFTLLTGYLILAGVCLVDYQAGPALSMGPFYLVPLAILTLVVNRRWATPAAIICSVFLTVLHSINVFPIPHMGMTIWNSIMRFGLFEIFVLLLDRIRLQLLLSSDSERSAQDMGFDPDEDPALLSEFDPS
jgi:hypothetical protein